MYCIHAPQASLNCLADGAVGRKGRHTSSLPAGRTLTARETERAAPDAQVHPNPALMIAVCIWRGMTELHCRLPLSSGSTGGPT